MCIKRKYTDCSTRKAFLEKVEVDKLVYKFDEKSYRVKVSQSLKYDSNFFFVHKHIYICMDTNTDHLTPLTLRVQGNNA